jgi:probable F420-dependent oxidoreductase
MKFNVEYPLGSPGCDPDFATATTLKRYARAAEAAGFSAIAFTDHPAPSHKWLRAGGHETFDPLVACGAVGLATDTIRVMTNLLVLPYRNPFVVAKAAATADILSDGRLTLAFGTGYLKSEYAALGVDFDDRNIIFDESFDLLPKLWDTDDIAFEGTHFTASGQTLRPRPVQQPGIPLWIGGNSALAKRRVARGAQGWTPLMGSPQMARTTRTPAFSSIAELKVGIDDMRRLLEEAGRGDDPFDIQVASNSSRTGSDPLEPSQYLDYVGELAEIGVTQTIIAPPDDNVEKSLELLAFYGETFINH